MKHSSLEFKQAAIKFVHHEVYSMNKAAQHLGVSHKHWKYLINRFSNAYDKPADVSKVTQQEQEIRRLKEELRQAKLETNKPKSDKVLYQGR